MSQQSMKVIGGRNIALLPLTTITTAVTGTTGTVFADLEAITYLGVNGVFVYGSDGTTAKFWVQTSFDQGTTWTDIVCFSVTTTSVTKFHVVKAGIAVGANQSIQDAALAANSILDGVFGDRLRIKYTTTGTYAGTTTMKIDGVVKT